MLNNVKKMVAFWKEFTIIILRKAEQEECFGNRHMEETRNRLLPESYVWFMDKPTCFGYLKRKKSLDTSKYIDPGAKEFIDHG